MTTATDRKPIILASQSPRRADLLREAGIAFEVVAPKYEEPDARRGRFSPAEYAQAASYFKTRSVAEDYPDRLILGADTVVALEGRLFGKPADRDDARHMLSTLGGTTHQVITGVTLQAWRAGRRLIRHDITTVTMRDLTVAQLDAYLDSGQWQSKAGAYGIQDKADPFVERIQGSFSNVVGLPIEMLGDMLTAFEDMLQA